MIVRLSDIFNYLTQSFWQQWPLKKLENLHANEAQLIEVRVKSRLFAEFTENVTAVKWWIMLVHMYLLVITALQQFVYSRLTAMAPGVEVGDQGGGISTSHALVCVNN